MRVVIVTVCFIFLCIYVLDLLVCDSYCSLKKKKDKEKKIERDFPDEDVAKKKSPGSLIKLLLNGWILFRVSKLGQFPSQKYRLWMLKHIFKMEISDKVVIYHWDTIRAPWNIQVGRGSIIGDNVILDGRNHITIGENVNISTGVNIYTEQHDMDDPYFRSLNSGGEVVIEKRAWISSHSTILPKVHVGEGAVLAAGAIATKKLDSYTVYGGIPAKKIGERNDDMRYEFDGEFLPFF